MKDKAENKKVQSNARMQREQSFGEVWPCKSCGFILGKLNQEKTQIRMKAKDFFITVQGGKIYHPCRSCGEFNELVDEEYLLWQSQQQIFKEFMVNRELFIKFLKERDDFIKFLSSPKIHEESKKKPQKSK